MDVGYDEIFERIYGRDLWGGGSGIGSREATTATYRRLLGGILGGGVKRVVDLGCGDWQFSRLIDWTGVDYLGVDVVPSVIEANQRDFARGNIRFQNADIRTCQLPDADLYLVKDVLMHWPDDQIRSFLSRMAGREMLITNSVGAGHTDLNRAGQFRPLDLRRPPFSVEAHELLCYEPTPGDIKLVLLVAGKHDLVRSALGLTADAGSFPTAAGPQDASALHHLALLRGRAGEVGEAVRLLTAAVRVRPQDPNLRRDLEESMERSRRESEITRPTTACPQSVAGPLDLRKVIEAHRAGRLVEAEALCRTILAASPDDAQALHRLGLLLHEMGRDLEAVSFLRRAIELKPDVGSFLGNLAAVMGTLGDHRQAAEHLRRALAITPTSPGVHHNLGVALERLGKLPEAEASHREALRLRPDYPEAHNHLGVVLRKVGRIGEAAECHKQAIILRPNYAEACNNLAAALSEQGDQAGAVTCQRRAVELQPASASSHSALLYTMHYDPASTPRMLLEEAKRWAERHGRFAVAPHENGRNLTAGGLRRAPFGSEPQGRRQSSRGCSTFGRLRVGYLSPDFRDHTVPRLIAPVLRHHDRSKVEVFCYSSVRSPDRVTERLRGLCDFGSTKLTTGWRDVSTLTDDAAAELIRSDRIDILVDLAGHWADNRMTLMARKPAPVQVQIGYPGTTGLAAMDYRITDAWSDPPGAEAFYAEKLWRLPRCAWCYEPDGEVSGLRPEAGRNACPTKSAGHVTFGCLNNPVKVTDQCLRLWGRILEGVPESRLLLLSAEGLPPDGGTQSRRAGTVPHSTQPRAAVPQQTVPHACPLRERLVQLGIDPARVEPVRRQARDKYLELFNRIDIALDPFPYNGETTTCDGLWMAVPHVALAGDRCASRRTMSHLCNLGLAELVASSGDEYIRIARTLATDLPRLAGLRASMRERMLRSPIMDYAGYTADLESAYRQMWRALWSAG